MVAKRRKSASNGQTYFTATPALVRFFEEEYVGGYSDIAKASGRSARTVASAMKSEPSSHITAKALYKVFREAGFDGNFPAAFIVI